MAFFILNFWNRPNVNFVVTFTKRNLKIESKTFLKFFNNFDNLLMKIRNLQNFALLFISNIYEK